MRKHFKGGLAVAGMSLCLGGGATVMVGGLAGATHLGTDSGVPQQLAAMAQRIFPSGSQSVVLTSGASGHYFDTAEGQALAARLKAPLLMTQGVNAVGEPTLQALKALAIPRVSTNVQPYQPAAGKPKIYVVGGTNAVGTRVIESLQAMGYTVSRIGGNTSAATKVAVTNFVAPKIPKGAPGFPHRWMTYAGKSSHNAFFPAPSSAPVWEKNGVRWNFAEMAAVPLKAGFPDLAQLTSRGAPVKMTQNLGNAVGVTATNGIIYAESDDYHLYAIDAHTGKLLWRSGALVNNLMGNPIVAHNRVIVTAGDTGFPFSQVLKYQLSGGTAPLVRGLMYSAIYAFNAKTGRLVWRHDFHGNAMPSPVVTGSNVYEATGGGNMWAFNVKTGKPQWKSPIGGFDSMSSANVWTSPQGQKEIVVGTSDKNHMVAVNASSGKVLWTQPTRLGIFNTGMGDNTPSIDQKNGIVVQDSVVNFDKSNKSVNLAVYAMKASTGQVLWSTTLGRGAAPPAYKAGMSMIHNGVVYVGSPTTSSMYALNEQTGKILWHFTFTGAGPAGAGRGNAVYAYHTLWVAAGPTIYALNPVTGQELGHYAPGGRFGIVNPVIVGGTMYVDNSYDWVQAIPLHMIDSRVKVR